jgi:hypothetical protein
VEVALANQVVMLLYSLLLHLLEAVEVTMVVMDLREVLVEVADSLLVILLEVLEIHQPLHHLKAIMVEETVFLGTLTTAQAAVVVVREP